jgi:hypothetical protein
MSGDPSDRHDLQALWRAQPPEHEAMTLAQIHQNASTFERRVRRRNLIEYAAAAVVVLALSPLLLKSASWMVQAGAGLTMAAAVMVAWHIHRIAAARPTPDGDVSIVAFRRQELARQRDALRSVGRWYLAPFIPGTALLMAGRWFQAHVPGRSLAVDHLAIAAGSAVVIVVFAAIWALNQLGARRLQREIDALDGR